jgi:hypothetical protein
MLALKRRVGGGEKMKCVVSDYLNGELKIISIDNSQIYDVEEILTENFEYSLENIEWIIIEDDNVKWVLSPSVPGDNTTSIEEYKELIAYDLEALKDCFLLKNKRNFNYHFDLLKGNLEDLLIKPRLKL